ncbi:MAG: flavodoxin family protein [Deltaproteobacteria bacterium]|nr:flavodoxin family protein [Deltaproteobacteria bacterium]
MKIVCVLGSPRKTGNSATLAGHFLQTANALGAESQSFLLNGLRVKGCQACYSCKKNSETCVIQDDLTEVLAAVSEAEVLVMATPTYYGEVSSQLKAFIDRTFSYLVPDFLSSPRPSRLTPGKKLVFIITQAQPDEKLFADVFPRYERFFKWYGYTDCHLVRVCGAGHEADMLERRDIVRLVEETARNILT